MREMTMILLFLAAGWACGGVALATTPSRDEPAADAGTVPADIDSAEEQALSADGDTGDETARAMTEREAQVRSLVTAALKFVFQTDVSIDRVEMDEAGNSMVLRGLTVANPRGFDSPCAISSDRVELRADIGQLFSRRPVIELVRAEGTEVYAETTLRHGSNLRELMKQAGRFGDGPLRRLLPQKQWTLSEGVIADATMHKIFDLVSRHETKHQFDRIDFSFRNQTTDEAVMQVLQRLIDHAEAGEDGTGVGRGLRRLFGL